MLQVLNQLDYDHIPYPTSLEPDAPPHEPYPSVAKAGCGLICGCMLVNILRGIPLTPVGAVDISVTAGANHFGTNMPVFAKKLAELYDLELLSGTERADLLTGLHEGSAAILHAGKPKGLFSDGGHFVLAVSATGDDVYVIDPSFQQSKYEKPYRQGLFRREPPFIVASASVVMEQIAYRKPSWYLFRRKNPL